MKNLLTNAKTRIISILSIATVIFLFASPAAVAVASSTKTAATAPAGVTPGTVHGSAVAGSPNKGGPETFVSNVASGAVDVLSSSGKLVTEIEDGGCSGYGVTYVPSTKMIWVFDYSCSTVYVINPATNKVTTSFSCTGCIFGVYFNKEVYASLFGDSEVVPLNAKTGSAGTALTVCGYYPEYLAVASDNTIYVPARFNGNGEGCYSIISSKNKVTNVDLGTYPNGVACASTGSKASCLISDEDNGNLYLVSGSKLEKTISGCSACDWGLAFNSASKDFIVTTTGSAVYSVSSSGKLGSAIAVNAGSDADCAALNKTVVVPLVLSSPAQASGISSKNKVSFTTNLGSDADEPEACASS